MSHDLNPPIIARYVRFRPIAWFTAVSMRVELYGCQGTTTRFKFIWVILADSGGMKKSWHSKSNFSWTYFGTTVVNLHPNELRTWCFCRKLVIVGPLWSGHSLWSDQLSSPEIVVGEIFWIIPPFNNTADGTCSSVRPKRWLQPLNKGDRLLPLSIIMRTLNSKLNRQTVRFSLPSIKCSAAPPTFRPLPSVR